MPTSSFDEIVYFDATGKEVGREPVAKAARFSARAAANERKMAAFKKAHPEVTRAHCDGGRFSFTANGDSRFEGFPKD